MRYGYESHLNVCIIIFGTCASATNNIKDSRNMERPSVWQMIKETIDNLSGKAAYPQIKKYIYNKWDNVNESTIRKLLSYQSISLKCTLSGK